MKKRPLNPSEPQKELVRLIKLTAHRHRVFEVFRDFCEVAAICLSNRVDRVHYDAREARYEAIKGRYTEDEAERFPQMFACLVWALEAEMTDVLGAIYMDLELGNDAIGQFFTPFSVSSLMAKLIIGDPRSKIERKGFLTVSDPAGGAGGMVIAAALALRDLSINYQQHLHATTVDIEATAVHMAYIQFSLLHIPAIVVHGNSLSLEAWDHWVTPAHVMGYWDAKLRAVAQVADDAAETSMQDAEAGQATVEMLADIRDRVVAVRVERPQMDLFD